MDYRYTNALANETSPYLLQHAHNPVDWHPWGEEALSKAKREDKPILLSILLNVKMVQHFQYWFILAK